HVEALRERLTAMGGHRRTPIITANLALGLRLFLQFATAAGALTPGEAEAHWANGWAALLDAADQQAAHHAGEDPVRRFRALLSGILASGQGHLADRTGAPPEQPAACGWRPAEPGDTLGRPEWRPQGLRIGWLDGERLYLNSEVVINCCRRLAGD